MVKVYEYKFAFADYITFLLFIMVYVLILFVIKGINRNVRINEWKKGMERVRNRIINLSVIFGGLMMLVIFGVEIRDYFCFYLPYKQNKYSVVEGNVQDFYTDSLNESFKVGEVDFFYRGYDGQTGYHTPKADGGYIRENDQHVIIEYIESDFIGNIIVGVWIEREEQKSPNDNIEE